MKPKKLKIDPKTLQNLSSEQQEELIELLVAEAAAKQRLAIESYNNPAIIGEDKVHKVQLKFHQDPGMIRLFMGGNRCISAGTRILCPNEKHVRIEDIRPGDLVLTVDPDTMETKPCKVSEVYNNGQQPVTTYRAWSRNGERRYITCTHNHHILTENGLQEAGYIPQATWVKRQLSTAYEGQDYPLAYALGYAVGRRTVRRNCVTYLGSSIAIHEIFKFYKNTVWYNGLRDPHPGEFALRGRLAPRFNKLATDFKALYGWLWKQHSDAVLDFADGFIDNRISIDKYAAFITVRTPEEEMLTLRLLRAMGVYASKAQDTANGGSKQLTRVVQLCSVSDITRLLTNLKLVKSRELLNVLHNEGVVDNAFFRYRRLQQESYWEQPKKAKVRVAQTHDLKLADGNNLYIADGFVVGNSGKTEAGAVEAYWYMSGTHPYKQINVPNNGRIIVESLELFEQDIIPKFKRWAPNFDKWEPIKGHQGKIAGYRLPNGSRVDVFTFNQESAKLEGTSIRWCWINEPPPQEHVIASIRGLVDQRGQMWMTLTPLSEPYLYTDYYLPATTGSRKDIGIHECSIYDNPWLDREYIDWYIKNIPEEDRPSRVDGKFRFLSGRVFKDFQPDTHILDDFDWPSKFPVTIGIDPHLRKPHAVVFLGVTKQGWYTVIDELSVAGDMEELGHAITERCFQNGYNVQDTMADSFIEQPDANRMEPKRILNEVLENAGLPAVRIAKKKNTKHGSISEIKRLLKIQNYPQLNLQSANLLFMRRCVKTIGNMMAYVYAPSHRPEVTGPNEEPVKTNDDFIDALRYALLADPHFEQRSLAKNQYKVFETYGGRSK